MATATHENGGELQPNARIREQLTACTLPFSKLMVANRGEISNRVIRAARELQMDTIAIYSEEDRHSSHRYKATESHLVAGPGVTPVGAYLHIPRIVELAVQHGAQAIHPGYGFLSENSAFARAVESKGIVFIGPSPETIDICGDKTQARLAAIAAGVAVVPGSDGPVPDVSAARAFAKEHEFPVIIKAAFGGGGRGMRVVRSHQELEESFNRCVSEAKTAFGDGTVFIEKYVENPRHIEVQILADNYGNTIHLFERDCSVQRRHQKVVECAPAPNFTDEQREALCEDAVRLAKSIKYRNAGTFEFLFDAKGRHYFIEANPRIQVEHTVTEEITGIDIVATQIEIAAGKSLKDLGLDQSTVVMSGCAIQCRVTTEDPSDNFRPDTGLLEVYRPSTGCGIRLDEGPGSQGYFISPHYDSLLVKVTARGASRELAIRRLLRAMSEFRVRGVKTNIPFLQRVLVHPKFIDGKVTTTFIEEEREVLLTSLPTRENRVGKLLKYLGGIAVNGSSVEGMYGKPARIVVPEPHLSDVADLSAAPPVGFKQLLDREGPDAYARAVRQHKGVLLMDTTWRDAHQSLLMTRMRTFDIARVASASAHALAGCAALECWGGATFDVSLRFLSECPWDRLRTLRKLVPNVPFQMLLRGANAVGYTSYPDNVVFEFVKQAKECGVDVFRIFDSLNYFENLKLGIDTVRAAGGVVEAAVCYTGDLSNPKEVKYTLEYYLDLIRQLVDYGIHMLAIKDMAGLLKPLAAKILIGAIRERFPDLPIHVHTHDTAGSGVASMMAAAEAGADIVDVAIDSMSGLTSQPSMGTLVANYAGTELDTGIKLQHVFDLNSYWSLVRELYSCFDPGLKAGDSRIYESEMPGGQYTNLLFQARSLGLGDQWEAVQRAYTQANRLLGNIVKVTPSSKVVGDLAQFMVQNRLDEASVLNQAETLSFPQSVVSYFQGHLGIPPGGFPEPLRTKVVKKLPVVVGRPGANFPPMDIDDLQRKLQAQFKWITPEHVMSSAMYPSVFQEFANFREKFGDVSVLSTPLFLDGLVLGQEEAIELDAGKVVYVKLLAVGGACADSAERDVFFEVNGQPRRIRVRDTSSAASKMEHPKAQGANDIGAPMAGGIIEVRVKAGSTLAAGDPICVLSAMKMETVVNAPRSGVVKSVHVKVADTLAAGDLIIVLDPK